MNTTNLIISTLFLLTFTIITTLSANVTVTKSKFSSNETTAIQKLQSLVEKRLPEAHLKDGKYLIRFLRVNNLNVQKAEGMLLSYLEFRKRNKLENITQEVQEAEKYMPYTLSSDRAHRPVVFVDMGHWAIRRLMVLGKTQPHKRVVMKIYERTLLKMQEAIETTDKVISAAVQVVDSSGFNIRQHGCFACIRLYQDVFEIYEKHYTQMYERQIFVNSPRNFESIWNIVKSSLSPETKESVTFYGFEKQEWKAELLKFMDLDHLPRSMGGPLDTEV